MRELGEGLKIESVWYGSGEGGESTVGKCGITSITITMEGGQMAAVPWAKIVKDDGSVTLVNCALLEGLKVMP